MRNGDFSNRLCNGTRWLEMRLMNGISSWEVLHLLTTISTPIDHKSDISLKQRRFVVLPTFCMTINKSQSQSFNHVGVDLREDVFGHGQLDVSLSRCRSSQNLKIQMKGGRKQLAMVNMYCKEYCL